MKKGNKSLTYLVVMSMVLFSLTACGKESHVSEETTVYETLVPTSAELSVKASAVSETTDASKESTATTESVATKGTTTKESATKETTATTSDKKNVASEENVAESKENVSESNTSSNNGKNESSNKENTSNTQSETPKVEVHTHTWVDESQGATCTNDGYSRSVCNECGEVGSSTTIPAIGHNYVTEDWGDPTCSSGSYACDVCTICGDVTNGRELPKLDHSWVENVISEGDCISPRITEEVCSVCGAYGGQTMGDCTDDHDITTTKGMVFDETVLDYVEVEKTYCTRCHQEF